MSFKKAVVHSLSYPVANVMSAAAARYAIFFMAARMRTVLSDSQGNAPASLGCWSLLGAESDGKLDGHRRASRFC